MLRSFPRVIARLVPFLVALLSAGACAQGGQPNLTPAKAFLGSWDLTLKAPDREYPSWLEISEQDGTLVAQMVGRWGNARPLSKVEFSNGRLIFASPKEEEGSKRDMVLEGTLSAGTLSGTTTEPDRTLWPWTGFIAPSPEMARRPGQWQTFDITLVGRTITVVKNGQTIIDQQEIPGITGGALNSHEELPGPIYLQGGEDGHVAYRNIIVTLAKQ